MHFLFVKDSLAWPRSSGHDVHSYHMMQALSELGHDVSLTTRLPPSSQAIAGLELAELLTWSTPRANRTVKLHGLQDRFRSYWGIEQETIKTIGAEADELAVDAVVAVGLEVLPLLAGVRNAHRIWYAADEWVWHHLSLVRLDDVESWKHVRTALLKGLYEFAFRTVVDRAWVVSTADQKAMRMFAQIRHVDVVPNGVATQHFVPTADDELPYSCVFWGRLDFEPNVQALEWFCRTVWPQVLQRYPTAVFRIFGFHPNESVQRLQQTPGIELTADLPDLRVEIARSQVVVLPFQSGGGIKNKLLEAAAMARPIVCSARSANGLMLSDEQVLAFANRPQQWVDVLGSLWKSAAQRQQLGQAARRWVTLAHTWEASARRALAPLQTARLGGRGGVAQIIQDPSGFG